MREDDEGRLPIQVESYGIASWTVPVRDVFMLYTLGRAGFYG
jgi:hypothetical protein